VAQAELRCHPSVTTPKEPFPDRRATSARICGFMSLITGEFNGRLRIVDIEICRDVGFVRPRRRNAART
jgi:hypothetical protein